MRLPSRPKVILRHCEAYEPQRIRILVREALQALEVKPFGRTLVKPNLVMASDKFPVAFTRSEVVEGLLLALGDVADGRMSELAVGERCGINLPTRLSFRRAGYDAMLARIPGVKSYLFEETQQREVRLAHPNRLRDYLFVPEPVAKADCFVNVPKFKSHPWTTVTFSMKNYIGLQDDRHRLIDHDYRLNEKVADLQYVIQPRFICVDAIVAGEGRMLSPKPVDLSLLVMSNSQVACDAVCCRIIGVEPREVEHIRLAEDRGFGTTDMGGIELLGDVSLEQAQQRAQGYEVGLKRVEEFFEGSKVTAYAGPPPQPEVTDYCWGGCPGALQEAMDMLRVVDEGCDEKLARLHFVFGAYDGEIHAQPGEWVVFVGDCAQWRGHLGGGPVEIHNLYQSRDTKDPHAVKHRDVFVKFASAYYGIFKGRRHQGQPFLRLRGCPVSVAEQLIVLFALGGSQNPASKEGSEFRRAYFAWRLNTQARRLFGWTYQKDGPCVRGEAAPELPEE